jgi:hypothetical protein
MKLRKNIFKFRGLLDTIHEVKRPIYGEEAWSFVDYSALSILYT